MLYLAAYFLMGGILTNAVKAWSESLQPEHKINRAGVLPWVLLCVLWPVFIVSTLLRLARRLDARRRKREIAKDRSRNHLVD